MRRLDIAIERWVMRHPLQVAGHVMREMAVVVATITEGRVQGRGEGSPIFYLGETVDSLMAQLESARPLIEAGQGRRSLRQEMSVGGARNALDCALWELESRQLRLPMWALAGQPGPPAPMLTTCTIGADTPAVMAGRALTDYPAAKALKLKLLGDGADGDRVDAVRAARPDVWLGVDGNQGFSIEQLDQLMPSLIAARVQLIEQPCAVGLDASLRVFRSPIALAADESVQTLSDIDALLGCYQVMNIKLDKCGGLTEALMMAQAGRRLGLQIMVGNMGGTSLAMAQATPVAQMCDIVDLDAPLFLASDRSPPMVYQRGLVSAPPGLWGWTQP